MFKIFKANLMIMLLLTLCFIAFGRTQHGDGLATALLTCLMVIFMFFINVVLGVSSKIRKNGQSQYYFLSAVLVLLIGVPLCFGGLYLTN